MMSGSQPGDVSAEATAQKELEMIKQSMESSQGLLLFPVKGVWSKRDTFVKKCTRRFLKMSGNLKVEFTLDHSEKVK